MLTKLQSQCDKVLLSFGSLEAIFNQLLPVFNRIESKPSLKEEVSNWEQLGFFYKLIKTSLGTIQCVVNWNESWNERSCARRFLQQLS